METFTTNYGLSKWDQGDVPPVYTAIKHNANWDLLDSLLGLRLDRLDTAWFLHQGYLPSTQLKGNLYTFPATDFQNQESQTHYNEYDNRVSIRPTAPNLEVNYGWDLGASYGKILVIINRLSPLNNYSNTNLLGLWTSNQKPPTPSSGNSSYPTNAYVGYQDGFLFHVGKYDNAGPPPNLTSLGTDSDGDGVGFGFGYEAGGPVVDGYALYADGTKVRLFIRRDMTSWTKVVEVSDTTFTSFRYAGFYLLQTSAPQSAIWIHGPAVVYAQ